MARAYWAVKIGGALSYKPKSSAGIPVSRQRRSTIALVSPVAFTHRRQLNEVRRDAGSALKIDEARTELLDTNGVLRIPVASSAENELPQSRHLGEGWSNVLRSVCGRDANLGRCDNDSTRPQ